MSEAYSFRNPGLSTTKPYLMTPYKSESKAALFIDYDNIQLTASKLGLKHCSESQLWTTPLITEIKKFTGGSVDIRKCYGDVMLNTGLVHRNRMYNPRDIRDLIEVDINLQYDLIRNGFQMIHTPAFSGKNRADILMALDCIEIALKHDQLDTFVILTQDSDFTPLFDKLRAAGKRVVLVTVSEPDRKSKSNQTLLSLVNKHIIYNQEIIDQYGYDLLKLVLNEMEEEEAATMIEGSNLQSINTRMSAKFDGFNFINLGYTRFKEFVEDCLPDEYELVTNMNIVRRKQDGVSSMPIVEHKKTMQAQTSLKKQGIKVDYRLISQIRQYTLEHIESWGDPVTYGEVTEKQLTYFHEKNHSKTQIRDAIRILNLTGFLSVMGDEELPLKQKKCVVFSELDLDGSLAYLIVDRIFQAGITVTDNDISEVSKFIFGDSLSGHQDVVREAVSILISEIDGAEPSSAEEGL